MCYIKLQLVRQFSSANSHGLQWHWNGIKRLPPQLLDEGQKWMFYPIKRWIGHVLGYQTARKIVRHKTLVNEFNSAATAQLRHTCSSNATGV